MKQFNELQKFTLNSIMLAVGLFGQQSLAAAAASTPLGSYSSNFDINGTYTDSNSQTLKTSSVSYYFNKSWTSPTVSDNAGDSAYLSASAQGSFGMGVEAQMGQIKTQLAMPYSTNISVSHVSGNIYEITTSAQNSSTPSLTANLGTPQLNVYATGSLNASAAVNATYYDPSTLTSHPLSQSLGSVNTGSQTSSVFEYNWNGDGKVGIPNYIETNLPGLSSQTTINKGPVTVQIGALATQITGTQNNQTISGTATGNLVTGSWDICAYYPCLDISSAPSLGFGKVTVVSGSETVAALSLPLSLGLGISQTETLNSSALTGQLNFATPVELTTYNSKTGQFTPVGHTARDITFTPGQTLYVEDNGPLNHVTTSYSYSGNLAINQQLSLTASVTAKILYAQANATLLSLIPLFNNSIGPEDTKTLATAQVGSIPLDSYNQTIANTFAGQSFNLQANTVTTTGSLRLSSSSIIASNVAAVPVPASVWMMATGLLAYRGLARKKAA